MANENKTSSSDESARDKKPFVAGAIVLVAVIGGFAALNHFGSDEATDAQSGETVLASIGDAELTDDEFAAYLRFKRITLRSEEQSARVLADYVERAALAEAIQGSDVLDQDLIEAELESFRNEMLISRYFERYLRTAVTDDSIRSFYESHAADYEDRKVHVAHVLVRMNRRMTEEERQAALTKAREAYSRLEAGDEFDAVVASYSEDRVTANRGGDMGWVRENTISPRFSETAFELGEGAYSEPFETPFGYHIVKVLEAPQTVRRPLEAVQGEIRARLREEAKTAEIQRLRDGVPTEVRDGGYQPPERPAVADESSRTAATDDEERG